MATPLELMTVQLDGTHVIQASAGTGKTYTMTNLFLRILLEKQLPVEQVLVVTFSRAATAELRDRIRSRLGDCLGIFERHDLDDDDLDPDLVALAKASVDREADALRLGDALRRFDEAAVFTIHGFCQRMLQENAFESGVMFNAELVQDQRPIFEEIVHDFWARATYQAPPGFVRYLQQQRMTPRTLQGLVARVAGKPKMPVLPAHTPPDDTHEVAVTEWRAAWHNASKLWQADGTRDQVEALLTAGDLKGTQYRKDYVAKWLVAMDALLFGAPPPTPSLFDRFSRFTPDELTSCTKAKKTTPTHAFFDACADLLKAGEALREALEIRLLQFKLDLRDYTVRELKRRQHVHHTQSFDDLLQQLEDALMREKSQGRHALARAIQGRYKVALIDEFQDTDPTQYNIFRTLFHDAEIPMFMIGDPKQAIYAFRGADIFAYLEAVDDAEGEGYTLATNWRSDPTLIRGLNALFGLAVDPFLTPKIDFTPVKHSPRAFDRLGGDQAERPPLRVLFLERKDPLPEEKPIKRGWAEERIPDVVASEIARLLNGKATLKKKNGDEEPVEPGDVAVLVRKNVQGTQIQKALRALSIPSVLQGEASVLETPEAEELSRVMQALADPGHANRVKVALTTPLVGLDAGDLLALSGPEGEGQWDEWLERFQAWHEIWRDAGFIQAFRRMMDTLGVQRRLLAWVDGERRLTNYLHLAELLHKVSTEQRLGMTGLIYWLSDVRAVGPARAGLPPESTQLRLESDTKAVRILTMHKSKGLEYPIVYCPYLWDGSDLFAADQTWLRFHDPRDGHKLKLDLGSSDHEVHLQQARWEAHAESLRLAYVALTRAQHACTFIWGAFEGAEGSPLAHLIHQPDDAATLPPMNPSGMGHHPVNQATRARFKALDDDGIRRDLQRLVQASKGDVGLPAVEVRALNFTPAPPYAPRRASSGLTGARPIHRIEENFWRMSSFSGLVVSADAHAVADVDLAIHDDEPEAPALDVHAVLNPEEAPEGPRVILADFPKGARPGTMLHAIYELSDFQIPGTEELERVARERLRRFGYDQDEWGPIVAEGLSASLDTPLHAGPEALTLRQLPQSKRLDELPFVLPVAHHPPSAPGPEPARLTGPALAAAFRAAPESKVPTAYIDRLEAMRFVPLEGFMKGFMDLVFEHDGLWYVVDYKSNHLGETYSDYTEEHMVEAMIEGDYFLQYHLYAVALHRHLKVRLDHYDYDTHFGGAYYLFIRGMHPDSGHTHGVFADRPPRRLIETLSATLADPSIHQLTPTGA
ncbi:MAG: exodeoxyribonuclease V subunit beta [Bradymonadia bacterium]